MALFYSAREFAGILRQLRTLSVGEKLDKKTPTFDEPGPLTTPTFWTKACSGLALGLPIFTVPSLKSLGRSLIQTNPHSIYSDINMAAFSNSIVNNKPHATKLNVMKIIAAL